MLWFLNWLPHLRKPEDGICSLNIFLLSDLRHKATKLLTAEVGTTPEITRPSEKPVKSKSVKHGGGPSTYKTAMVVVHRNPFSRLSERMRVL